MGQQDKRFAETANTQVSGRKGIPRYEKRFNAKGNRKHGRFRVEEAHRTRGNQFSAAVNTAHSGKGEHRAD